jgi:hypothetical protein
MPITHEMAITRLVECLESARLRPRMYLDPVSPKVCIDWLAGLRGGCSLFDLHWSIESRWRVLEARGLELGARWEDDQLARRGLDPEAIVDELLAIEIEMWKGMSPEEIQSLKSQQNDSLIDDLLESNASFRALVERSKASPRRPFPSVPDA